MTDTKTAPSTEPLLAVFEDRGASEDAEAEDELYKAGPFDPKAPKRPRRAVKYPTDFRASAPVMTAEEKGFVEKIGNGESTGRNEKRPIGAIPRKKKRRTVDEMYAAELAGASGASTMPENTEAQPNPLLQGASRDNPRDRQEGFVMREKVRTSDNNALPLSSSLPGLTAIQTDKKAPKVPALSETAQDASRDAFSQLHHEVKQFASNATPSDEDKFLVGKCLQAVRGTVADLWPYAQTEIFGSQAAGLAMPGSDIDIVVLGVVDNLTTEGDRYSKPQTMAFLSDLRKSLRSAGVMDQRRPVNIINAKVPIIKCSIKPVGQAQSYRTDISLGVDNGVKAVALIQSYMKAFAPLHPLVIVIKSLLKERKLHEVHTGGLSSYSIVNMVIAHLMAEGYTLENRGQGGVNQDMGHLLWGFLTRFGTVFDYHDQAVSITKGGVINKKSQWRVRFKSHLLAVEDPLQPGKDIASGSFNITLVQALFADSAEQINRAVEQSKDQAVQDEESLAWERIQAEGKHRSVQLNSQTILGSILDAGKTLQM